MKQRITRLLAGSLLATMLLGSGCAASYTPITAERINTYQSAPSSSPVQLGYQFDALRLRGRNRRYVKKEAKHGYHVVAVRVTNSSAADINFSRDAVLYYGDRPVQAVPGTIAGRDMRQGVAIYLLYLLLNFRVGGTTTYNGYGQAVTSGGTFLPTGPFIAGGNMLGAGMANKNFREELERYDLTNRNIRPGETVYGLLCLREYSVAPLRLELRTLATAPGLAPAPPAPATLPTPAPAQALPAGTPDH